jgi:hypothetical protein
MARLGELARLCVIVPLMVSMGQAGHGCRSSLACSQTNHLASSSPCWLCHSGSAPEPRCEMSGCQERPPLVSMPAPCKGANQSMFESPVQSATLSARTIGEFDSHRRFNIALEELKSRSAPPTLRS